MCGIVGFYTQFAGKLFYADDIISQLLLVNQVRGRDATGMFGIHKEHPKHVHMAKMVGNADHFLQWKTADDRFFKRAEMFKFLVGHNRAATIGKHNDPDAAHPHQVGNITLVHNGTLRGDYPYKNKITSDSKAIATCLNEEADFREVSKEINGAWALVWHDKRDESLNFVRNTERPLSFVEAGGDLWFGSEHMMLQWILARNQKTIHRVYELPSRQWIKIYPDGTREEIEVPFPTFASTFLNDSILVETEEEERAKHSVQHGGAVKSFGDTKVWASDDPPKAKSTAVVVKDGVTESVGTVKSNKSVVPLDTFCGIEKGSTIMFAVIGAKASELRKDAPQKTVVEGPLAVFTEDAEKGMEFLNGVEVRGRLSAAHDQDSIPIQNRLAMALTPLCLNEGVVTAIIYNKERKRVTLYTKDCAPQDWANLDDWDIGEEVPKKAWNSPVDPSAPEVAEIEKKS